MFNAPSHHQEHCNNHTLITSSHPYRHYHDSSSLPLDIVLNIFSFMQLIDLCRLLQQVNNDCIDNDNDSVSDCCSYTVLSRAKAERWHLAVYTSASYMVALCQGDPEGRLALARLSCTGFDPKEGVLRFETTSSEPVLLHDLPSSIKLVCIQWPCRPAEDCATIELPLCNSTNNSSDKDLVVCHQATNLSSDAKLSCRMMTATDHHDNVDGDICHACNHRACHHHQKTKMYKVWFDKAFVSFQWLQRGLLQGL